MNKVFIYKMNAGMLGTDEALPLVSDIPLSHRDQEDYVYDHATSYQEEDEDGEWPEGDPEIWLERVCTTKEEIEEESGYLLCGHDTLEDLISRLEADGMVFQ
jgi:hypothetical protein